MFSITARGSYKTDSFLKNVLKKDLTTKLDRYGRIGVEALRKATPIDSGLTASSWYYRIVKMGGIYTIQWCNSDIENGAKVAILIQYGHGTRGGGYVQGRDYINPAIRPVFDQIAFDVWKAVTTA